MENHFLSILRVQQSARILKRFNACRPTYYLACPSVPELSRSPLATQWNLSVLGLSTYRLLSSIILHPMHLNHVCPSGTSTMR